MEQFGKDCADASLRTMGRRRSWQFINLSETAILADGKVGYVQPIGDRAIPDQMVDADSQANFGVGATLLAACEYYKYSFAAPAKVVLRVNHVVGEPLPRASAHQCNP